MGREDLEVDDMSAMKERRFICKKCKSCGKPDSVLARKIPDELKKFPPSAFKTHPKEHDKDAFAYSFEVLPEGKVVPFYGKLWVPCSHCGEINSYQPVKGVFNPDKKCNAKCLNAKGFSCECACAGKNHGAGLEAVDV